MINLSWNGGGGGTEYIETSHGARTVRATPSVCGLDIRSKGGCLHVPHCTYNEENKPLFNRHLGYLSTKMVTRDWCSSISAWKILDLQDGFGWGQLCPACASVPRNHIVDSMNKCASD